MANTTEEIKFALDINKKEVRTSNGITCQLNDCNEFEYNGKLYVVYNFTTTLVKHKQNSLSEIQTQYFNQPLFIEKELAQLAIHDIANITQFQLDLSDETGLRLGGDSASLVKTLKRIKDDTFETVSQDNLGKSLDQNLKQVVQLLVSRVNDYNPEKMIQSLPTTNKLKKMYPKNTTTSALLEDLIKYVVFHNNFHEAIVDNRGLTIFPDTIFLLAVISILMKSHDLSITGLVNLSTIRDLVIHCVIDIAYSIITMRLDYELFIKERNVAAKGIKTKFYQKFPTLAKAKSLEALGGVSSGTKIREFASKFSVDMYPYIMLYGQPDKIRIKTIYSECRTNKSIEQACQQSINWLHPDVFITKLQEFSNLHSSDFCRYDTEMFIQIISTFITQPENLQIAADSMGMITNNTAKTEDRMEID
ncbi:P51 [Homarus gammarus nudivirus]|uniref:P51 n=1 Tax=Homarus gammarus nudivirus TaxID=2509616 RepID=A0A411HB54_9VIRU|nr:P51 [Homarus gammarus nudivirus]QBB28622.1 P51 [Homarus gammarus nudivirus]